MTIMTIVIDSSARIYKFGRIIGEYDQCDYDFLLGTTDQICDIGTSKKEDQDFIAALRNIIGITYVFVRNDDMVCEIWIAGGFDFDIDGIHDAIMAAASNAYGIDRAAVGALDQRQSDKHTCSPSYSCALLDECGPTGWTRNQNRIYVEEEEFKASIYANFPFGECTSYGDQIHRHIYKQRLTQWAADFDTPAVALINELFEDDVIVGLSMNKYRLCVEFNYDVVDVHATAEKVAGIIKRIYSPDADIFHIRLNPCTECGTDHS